MHAGESVGMAEILQEILKAIMNKEREYFLNTHKGGAKELFS